MNREKLKKMPVFKCLPSEDGNPFFLTFWCPYCKDWHHHGQVAGSREAHCTEYSSPLLESGYIIKPYTKAELLKIRRLIDIALEFKAAQRLEKVKPE